MTDLRRKDPLQRRSFHAVLLPSTALIGFGIYNLFHGNTDPNSVATWMFGALLGHDLLLSMIIILIGRLVATTAPPRMLAPAQAFLIAAGTIILIGFPAVSGNGDRAGDATRLPHDYELTVPILAVLAGGLFIAATLTARRQSTTGDRAS